MKKLNYYQIHTVQHGFVAPLAMVLMIILLLLGVAAINISTNSYSIIQNDNMDIHAQLASDAGLDDAIQRLSENFSWTPSSGQTTVMSDTNGIRTTYQVTVSNGSTADEKIVRSTGRVFRTSSADPVATRAYETAATLASEPKLTGSYTIATGPGGLELSGSGSIRGNVYVGGSLRREHSVSIDTGTGNSVQVADNRCGTGDDFPRICTSADGMGEPIVHVSGGGHIVIGTVYANNQVSSTSFYGPGLVAGTVPAYRLPPPPSREPIKNAISANMTGAAASCTSGGGSVTWPANVKIDGNVNISGFNCTVTISGNTWITGNLTVNHSGTKIRYATGLTERPIIMVDGPNGIYMTGSGSIAPGVGGRFVAYHSAASCSPECADVTGQDLINSINMRTIYNGIDSDGNDFMSAWGTLHVAESGGSRGSGAGQKVIRDGSGVWPGTVPLTISSGSSGSDQLQVNWHRRVY